jgi:hypothetical protein
MDYSLKAQKIYRASKSAGKPQSTGWPGFPVIFFEKPAIFSPPAVASGRVDRLK